MSPRWCIGVEVDGEKVMGTFDRKPTEADIDAFREAIRAARAQFADLKQPVVTFDLETTGVDVETARIVSAALVWLDQHGEPVKSLTWLLDPGVPIPDEAAEVHGITTEHAREHGMPAAEGVQQLAEALSKVRAPLVVFNAPFDLSIVDREIRRHEVGIVGDIGGVGGIWWDVAPVVDPLVLDKHVDRYRKGSRKLVDICALRGVELGDAAHSADADAIAAGRLAQWMLGTQALAGVPSLAALHDSQVRWCAEQASSFADYLHSRGEHERALTVAGVWPYSTPDD